MEVFMVDACLEEREWSEPRIIFTVPLPNMDPAYMSMTITEYGMENSAVVIVDAQKFLHLWRSDPYGTHAELANGTPLTWPNDYKYDRAVAGFSHGRANPVPLPDISFGTAPRPTDASYQKSRTNGSEQVEYIAFTNGITRTIWLLAQGCKAFPVKCDIECASGLVLAAGVEGVTLQTLSELAMVLPRV